MSLPRIIVTFICLLMFSVSCFSQEVVEPGQDVLYRKEKHGGILLHSNGVGAFYRDGKHITGKTKRMLEFELVSMKHPKEIKVSPTGESSQSYVFGKLNTLTILRSGIGLQKKIHGKDGPKGVEVRYHYFTGASLGLAKPVYLEVINGRDGLVSEKYDPQKHQQSEIFGKAPATQGLTEIKPYPGAYAKFGFAFEYSGTFNSVKALETGIVLDAYAKTIPIMAFTKNYQVFTSVYIALVFGNKEF